MKDASASRPWYISKEIRKPAPHSSARLLLKYAGKWAGSDLEERLADVYATRGEAEF